MRSGSPRPAHGFRGTGRQRADHARADQVAAVKALDRVLLNHHYIVPSYTLRKSRIAYWDKFDRPKELPYYSIGFPTVWWAK